MFKVIHNFEHISHLVSIVNFAQVNALRSIKVQILGHFLLIYVCQSVSPPEREDYV